MQDGATLTITQYATCEFYKTNRDSLKIKGITVYSGKGLSFVAGCVWFEKNSSVV